MKKILLSLSLLFCTTLVSFGQELNTSTEKRVNLITRVMASQLGLNESEYLRLKALNRERVVKSDEIAELYAHNQVLQSQKMQELEESFDKKFRAMLSPSQAAAYASYRLSPDTEIALSKPSAASKKE
ncbi:MAG: hypothetical protein ACO1NZ_09430 [Adhaeribacter sp.]|jgi:hypothetical protein